MERKFNSDIWRKVATDYHCDLRELKNAIIIAYYYPDKNSVDSYYSISPRSFFPFKNKYYDQRFTNAAEPMALAEKIIRSWVESLFEPENKVTIKQINE